MKTRYIALLRGINVGGKNMVKMADLKATLEQEGFEAVSTYIQSGNVIFSSSKTNTSELAVDIEKAIAIHFKTRVGVAVFSAEDWRDIVAAAPKTWGNDPEWKHNLLIMLEPYDMKEVVSAIGTLKPDIERLDVGKGVLYQSVSFKLFGRTTTGKLAANPVYKQMTIRNYNTALKLSALLQQD